MEISSLVFIESSKITVFTFFHIFNLREIKITTDILYLSLILYLKLALKNDENIACSYISIIPRHPPPRLQGTRSEYREVCLLS